MRTLLKKAFYSFSINKFNAQKDYYKILGVSSSADEKQIKKSFREMAKKYHPDAGTGNQEKFKEVNEAYQVLSQAQIKKQYDMTRMSNSSSSTGQSWSGNYGSNPSGYQNSYNNNGYYYQSGYTSSGQNPYQQQQSNYRGYARSDGWQNQKYREQVMNQIFKEYQREMNGQYEQAQRNRAQYGSFEDMYRNHQESIRQYTAEIKRRQEQVRRAQEAQQYRRQKQFRQYQDQQVRDFQKKLNQKVNDLKDGIVNNVHGFVKVGSFLKDTFKNISDAVQNLKKGDDKDKNGKK